MAAAEAKAVVVFLRSTGCSLVAASSTLLMWGRDVEGCRFSFCPFEAETILLRVPGWQGMPVYILLTLSLICHSELLRCTSAGRGFFRTFQGTSVTY